MKDSMTELVPVVAAGWGAFSLKFKNGWTVSVSTMAVPPAYKQGVPHGCNADMDMARAVEVVAWPPNSAMETVAAVAYPEEVPALLASVQMRPMVLPKRGMPKP